MAANAQLLDRDALQAVHQAYHEHIGIVGNGQLYRCVLRIAELCVVPKPF